MNAASSLLAAGAAYFAERTRLAAAYAAGFPTHTLATAERVTEPADVREGDVIAFPMVFASTADRITVREDVAARPQCVAEVIKVTEQTIRYRLLPATVEGWAERTARPDFTTRPGAKTASQCFKSADTVADVAARLGVTL